MPEVYTLETMQYLYFFKIDELYIGHISLR